MTWFKVDDVLTFHPRVVRAGNAAIGLWTRAGTFCSEHLTDGWISRADARLLGKPSEIAALVREGLWQEENRDDTAGYQFWRWAESGVGQRRQPTRAEVEERRRIDRDRKASAGRKGAEARWDSENRDVGFLADSSRNPAGLQSDSSRPPMAPVPSRPVPDSPTESPTAPSEQSAASPRRRSPLADATRIPEPFVVTGEMRHWAADEVPGIDIDFETREFVDFWRGATRNAMKKDWLGTWRNRMREAWKRAGKPTPRNAPKFTPFEYSEDRT